MRGAGCHFTDLAGDAGEGLAGPLEQSPQNHQISGYVGILSGKWSVGIVSAHLAGGAREGLAMDEAGVVSEVVEERQRVESVREFRVERVVCPLGLGLRVWGRELRVEA